MSKNSDYAALHAQEAMDQMERYGIPASVTLAQAILESRSGQSQLATKDNNHFGIKATQSWLNAGGAYGIYTDDKPDEKFCSYPSVAASYEHHSQFLATNKRYAACFSLAADDYVGWTNGIANAGYATAGGYAQALQRIIEQNNLQQYDRQVMERMAAEGRTCGENRSTYAATSVAAISAQASSDSVGATLAVVPPTAETAIEGTTASVAPTSSDQATTPEEWLRRMLSSEDANGLSASGDPLVELAVTAFVSLMALAKQVDGKQVDASTAEEAAKTRTIDLTPLVGEQLGECSLTLTGEGKAVLKVDNDLVQVNRELSERELTRLSDMLQDDTLSDETKRLRVSNIVQTAVFAQLASNNFEENLNVGQSQTESLRR